MTGGPLESETCREAVRPALERSGWADDAIIEQLPVREGNVRSLGGVTRDLGNGYVDYVLHVADTPVAVVEAKREWRAAGEGLQQAVRYAQQLDVPLAYSTNGSSIIERDMLAGTERIVEGYASPAEAWSRYATQQGLDVPAAELLSRPLNRSRRSAAGDVLRPRWYQGTAVRRVLAAVARGEHRILLLMATGTGKTFTAMQIVHMLREHARVTTPDRNHRVLYLADRDELVDAPMRKDFTVAFGSGPLRRVSREADRRREIYFATYQALAGGHDDTSTLFEGFPPDFFDVVIVDECHRGSAAENSSWRRILEHFAPAVQLGLTATPKQDDTVDTYAYFGEPVFTYTLRQGIEDGFLAPYLVRRVTLSPDADGWEPEPGQVDRFGREIPEGRYSTRDFERVVRLLARTDLAAEYLTRVLRGDPRVRMMVFCVDQQHADDMRRALANANQERMADDPEWVVRIVGSEVEKKRLLEAFCDPERDSPVVATTSRLLSTGVDVPDLKFVVLFRPVGSIVEFKQIIGRGTRLYPEKGKTSFEIIDFVGATAHFADPDFDGFPTRIIHDPPIDAAGPGGGRDEPVGSEDPEDATAPVVAQPVPTFTPTTPGGLDAAPPPLAPAREPRHRFVVDAGSFHVVAESVHIPDTSTGRLVLTEYGEYVAGQIRKLANAPDVLTARWMHQETRAAVLSELAANGVAVADLMPPTEREVDLLDLLVQLAWNVPSRTRAERARRAREAHHADLEQRSETARTVLSTLLDLYATHGIDDVTSPEVLRSRDLAAIGSPRDIASAFGGPRGFHGAVRELQQWIYSDKTAS